MFDEYGVILSRHIDFFSGTDSFGQSLITEIIEPIAEECKFLSQMAEELYFSLEKIDTALAEVRAMGG